jgi:hypothetical protein
MVSKAVKAQLEVLQDLGLHLRASPLVDGLGTSSVSRCGCSRSCDSGNATDEGVAVGIAPTTGGLGRGRALCFERHGLLVAAERVTEISEGLRSSQGLGSFAWKLVMLNVSFHPMEATPTLKRAMYALRFSPVLIDASELEYYR